MTTEEFLDIYSGKLESLDEVAAVILDIKDESLCRAALLYITARDDLFVRLDKMDFELE